MRRAILFSSLLVLVFITALATSSLGSVSPKIHSSRFVRAPGDSGVLVRQSSVSEQSDALSYWTPARMAAAKPRELSVTGPFPNSSAAPIESGNPGMVPGRDQAGNTLPTTQNLGLAAPFVNTAYRYPYPFERFEAPGLVDYTSYPYSTVGKIFGTDSLGDFECSGSVINSVNLSVVWTAGHCVDGTTLPPVFVPGYRNGTAPFGIWTAQTSWVSTQWHRKNNLAFDLGALILAPDSTGRQIVNVTGGLGMTWNISPIQHWHIIGYPAASPFNGELQWTCTASQASVLPITKKAPPTLGVGCDITPGASGGPWIASFGNQYAVNGLVSYSVRGYPKATFGPYFGDVARNLFGCATDGVC